MSRGIALTLALTGCAGPASQTAKTDLAPAASASASASAPRPAPPARGEVTLSRLPTTAPFWDSKELKNDPKLPLDKEAAQACYRDHLAASPTTTGWLLVQAQMAGDGSFSDLVALEQQGLPPDLVRCVLKAQRAPAEPPQMGSATVTAYARFR